MPDEESFGDPKSLLIRAVRNRLLEPARFFAVTSPGLFGVGGITVLRFARRLSPAASVLQNLLWLHTQLAGFRKPLVAGGFDFIDFLVLDFILGFPDQSLELLDGSGFDDVFDSIAHSHTFAVVNVRSEESVIKITKIL